MIKFILSILFLAAGFGILQLEVRSTWDDIQVQKQKIAAVDDGIGRAKQVQRILEDLHTRYNGITEDDLNRIRGFLPTKPQKAEFLIDLDIMATQSAVKASGISFTEGGSAAINSLPSSIQALTVRATVEGSYEAFRTFLDTLQKNLRLIDVQNISFSSSGNQTGDKYTFQVELRTYYQQDQIL